MKASVLLSAIFLICSMSFGQTVINSSGKNISNSTNTLTYSIGEIVVKTINNSQNILTQGFLQTNYQTVSTINNQIFEANLIYYPNPVATNLCIETDKKIVKIQIFDINGKVVYNQQFENKPINISHLISGIYIVKTIDIKQNIIKSFKIIKQ